MSNGTFMREDGARGSWPSAQLSLQWGAWKLGVFCLSIIFFGLVRFVKFVAMLDVHSGGPGEEGK
jgi:hypothetical protein